MKKQIELLAPAGSYEALQAAVQNGANAIYLGGNNFSARAFATNFNRDELKQAVIYGHLRNVKIYVTVNTLYEDNQFENLKDYLLFLASINVDALIIQDLGLMAYVKKYFPDFEIHMSTQTSIYSLSAVKYFEHIGVDRIVLARENSLEEIKNICNNSKLDIEVFVHGALCMSYSGQCLMSSMIAKRSGNKGACGQPCRLAYKLQKDGKNLDQLPSYLLSPKDLCTIKNVGDLIEAGITSFKIEGRMKRPEYVAIIVKQYREAIDAYFQKHNSKNYSKQIKEMKQMFNRGFKSVDYTRTITKLFLNHRLVNQAAAKDIIEIELNTPVKKGEAVYKIIDIELIKKAHDSYQKEQIKNPITMHFKGQINYHPTLTITYQNKTITVVSKLIMEAASKAPLNTKHIEKQLSKLGNTVFKAADIIVEIPENAFFSLKEINEMRRQAIDKLVASLTAFNSIAPLIEEKKTTHLIKMIKGICVRVYSVEQLKALLDVDIEAYYFPLSPQLKDAIEIAKKHHKKIIPFTGFLNDEKQLFNFKNSKLYLEIDAILVGNYGALEIFNDKKCILDTTFNLYNSYALNYLKAYDAILSLEMSKKQINNLSNITQNIIVTVYGKTINKGNYHLVDRKNEKFRILTDNNCNNLIFNSHSLYINKLDNLNVDFILLSFSDEDGQTARFIYDQFKQILSGKIQQITSFINHTNGYFYD